MGRSSLKLNEYLILMMSKDTELICGCTLCYLTNLQRRAIHDTFRIRDTSACVAEFLAPGFSPDTFPIPNIRRLAIQYISHTYWGIRTPKEQSRFLVLGDSTAPRSGRADFTPFALALCEPRV